MIELSLDTWVSLAALAAALITMYGMIRRGARSDARALRTELKSDVAGLRTELKGDIARLEGAIEHLDQRTARIEENIVEFRSETRADITRLDDRVYALAVGLRPLIEHPEQAAAAG
jgi:chromosome segregation ATPase